MKKRLVCLFLCLVMVLAVVLTGCSEKSDEEAKADISENASQAAMTLSMWVVCDEEVSADNAAAVNEALNAITNSKFKTKLVVNYLTEDEYRAKLEEAIEKFVETQQNQLPEEEETETGTGTGEEEIEEITDATETNSLGMTVIKYPELLENQVDIVYIAGEEMYLDFVNKGWLANLNTELDVSAKKLYEYVSGTLLSAARVGESTYAIPNNRTIGEYKYMLLNKELMQKYSAQAYWEEGLIDGFYNENLYSFLNQVYQFEADVIPIDSTYDECLQLLAHFWSIDSTDYSVQLDKFSVFGYHYENMADLNRGSVMLGFDSLFEDPDFANGFLKLNEFRMKEYFGGEDDSRTKVAVKFATGDSTILQNKKYVDKDGTEYYPVVVGYPTATSSDIYGNMFGICSASVSVSRSMQIITYLNTNPEFRNILQYGVEDMHYTLEKNEETGALSVKRKTDPDFRYMMDIYATGNAFIAYPDPIYNMSDDIWENGKVQNRASLVDPLLGFDLKEYAQLSQKVEDEVVIGDDGYTITFSTGYSKSVVMQNETLKSFIEASDKKGPGVYALKTYQYEDDYYRAVYYLYNTDITEGSVDIAIGGESGEPSNIMADVEDPKTGEISSQRVGINIDIVYVANDKEHDTFDEDGNAYEFTVVYADVEKDLQVGLRHAAGRYIPDEANPEKMVIESDDPTATPAQELQGRLVFDFNNTEKYSISTYDLTKATVLKNTTLIEWVLAIDKKNLKKPNNYLMQSKKYYAKNGEELTVASETFYDAKGNVITYDAKSKTYVDATGKTAELDHIEYTYVNAAGTLTEADRIEYIYVVYRSPLTEPTKLVVQPTGESDQLAVNFDFLYSEDEIGMGIEAGNLTYLFSYISVIADADATVAPVLRINGVETEFDEVTDQEGFSYDRLGNLDTDLVKFMEDVNEKVELIWESQYATILANYETAVKKAINKDGTVNEKALKTAIDTALSAMETVVNELSELLSTDESVRSYKDAYFPTLKNEIKEYFCVDDKTTKTVEDKKNNASLSQFRRNVRALASYKLVEYKVNGEVGDYDPDFTGEKKEPFVYFDSPYMLYYAWMKEYGYLPDGVEGDNSEGKAEEETETTTAAS